MRKAALTAGHSWMRALLPAALLFALATPCGFASQTGATDILPSAPVDHFRVYGFDKDTGWRSWQLEGAKAEFPSDGSVKVSDMRLHVYDANDSQTVNMLILSPVASMPKSKDYIGGPGSIVLTAKGVYLGGENWTWQPDGRTLIIRKHTHAVIDGELGPILE